MGLVALGSLTWFSSCSDDSDTGTDVESVENYVSQAVYSLQTEVNAGKMGCYEFVFPVTINFPDGNTSTADSYASLKEQIRSWIKDNAESIGLPPRDSIRGKCEVREILKDAQLPKIAFPVDVLAEDGTVITVDTKEALIELKKACRKDFYGGKGRHCHDKGDQCFKLVFPITVEFPDGTIVTAASKSTLKEIIRAWHKRTDRPNHVHPKLVFPLTIEFEDGTKKVVDSQDALKAERKACAEG